LFFSRIVAYIRSWSEIPKGKAPEMLIRSFLVVTIRSIRVRDVIVVLVASCTTFCIPNRSKTEQSFSAFVYTGISGLPLFKRSQLKSPSKMMFDDFSQAFSSVGPMRWKKSHAPGGLYMTENNTELRGNLTCNQIASRPSLYKSFRWIVFKCST